MACVFTCFIANAQESRNVQREFTDQAAFPFLQLERQRVPHGILQNYSLGLTELTLYDGVVRDTNSMDIQVFSDLFRELHSARIHPSSEENFVSMEAYAKRWNNYRKDFNSVTNDETTIVLGGLLYKYSIITQDALSEGKITFEGNQFRDVYRNGVWQNPYKENVAAAIAAPVPTVPTESFNVVFPRDMFLGNDVENIETIKIDFDNGEGFKNIVFNEPVQVAGYSTPGKYIWKAEIKMNDGRRRWIDIIIEAIERAKKYNVHIANGNYGATLRIDYLDDDDTRITKPLIVAEGFDPGSVITPEVKGGSTTLDDFKMNLVEPLEDLLLGNQEYDIIYVDWDNGIGDIKQNAETLKKIIKYVNNQKLINSSTEPNILLGQSMGGLIGKYALVKLEDEGYTHQVKLFATHDSPLRGSNTPVGIQAMGRHVLEMYVGNPFASSMGEEVLPLFQDLMQLFGADFMDDFSTPADNLTLMDAPAAVQMNNYYVAPNYDMTADYHNSWQTEFDALGYPDQDNIRNIAISNGNMCAETQGYGPGAHLLKFTKETDQNEFKSVLRDMGMTFWGATSHMPNLVIASQIPGPSRLRIDFQIRVLPETNATDREVYRGILKYDKFVEIPEPIRFWKKVRLGTITVDMYDKKVSAPNWCLPIENLAGGKENLAKNIPKMLENLTNVKKYVVNETFSFVPVASALDIRRNNANPNLADYRRAYSSTNLGDINLSSPFDNFMAEARGLDIHTQLQDNFSHINFSLKSAGFLATEMNAITNSAITVPNADCSFFCGVQEIYGADIICDKTTVYTYSIPELPAGAEVRWFPVGLRIIAEENGGSVVKVEAIDPLIIDPNNPNGKSLRVRVRLEGCGEINITKIIHYGVPTMSGSISGPTQIHVFSNTNFSTPINYTAPDAPGVTHYEWIFPGNFQVVSSFGNPLNIPQNWELLGPGNSQEVMAKSNNFTNGQIKVRACNECGCSNYITLNVNHQNYSNPGWEIAPNPTTGDILNVMRADGAPRIEFPSNRTDVFIYNLQSQRVHQFEISSEGGSTNVAHLAEGVYKVQIDMKNGAFEVLNLSISR